MYIPSINKFDDQQEAIAFMRRYSFAAIVTAKDGVPVATHLPFLVQYIDDKVILSSHFAKANPQWIDIVNSKVLVIFTEPHAYISPKHYEKETEVPTWNYLAVHAYGNCILLDSPEKKAALLKETILNFEEGYLKQWDNLPEDFKLNMMKGIVAFQVIVDDLQAKKKLSQNKTEKERENIVNELSNKPDSAEKAIAEYMVALKTGK